MNRTLSRYDTARLLTLSADRRRASQRVLSELEALLGGDLAQVDAESVRRLLHARAVAGRDAATLRKERAIVLAFATWACERGSIDAATLLTLRTVGGTSAPLTARPAPYRPGELRKLRATLDERWPLLPADERAHRLRRYRDNRSPFSRVRPHVVHCQLDAIIALALHLGLRRREIFALDIVTAHSDNAELIVWTDNGRSVENCRSVPFTDHARAAVSAWLDCRYAIAPDHRHLWLNLHAEPTSRHAMTVHTFNRLLATYVGTGWELRRLRDTCAAAWVRAGLPLEHLRQLLGLARIEDTLPYARLVGGSLEGRMVELDDFFDELVGAVTITGEAA